MKGLTLDRRATFFLPMDLVTFNGYLGSVGFVGRAGEGRCRKQVDVFVKNVNSPAASSKVLTAQYQQRWRGGKVAPWFPHLVVG